MFTSSTPTNINTSRFAPSPTGYLHIGHAYSAIFAYNKAKQNNGRFILRIEDIDLERSKPEYKQAIFEDLKWLGLSWEHPVREQSKHFQQYKKALDALYKKGVLYPCFCTRKKIRDEQSASASAPHGPEGLLYPRTCRHISKEQRDHNTDNGMPFAVRLDVEKAINLVSGNLKWIEESKGEMTATPAILGDVILARKDVPASYHLSVVVDDHIQGITHVTRGEDLLYATNLHRLLQELLGLHVPKYDHHKLLLDEEGKRFAKRNQSVTIKSLREEQKKSPEDIYEEIGLNPLT